MPHRLIDVKKRNSKIKGYTIKKKTRVQETQLQHLSLGETVEHKAMSTYETKAILSEPFAKMKVGTKESRVTIASLSKSATVLLEVIKHEAINKLYFKSLGDGGTQTNGKYANINLLCLSYEWYLKYFEACFGLNATIKPLTNKNYYSVLKELVKADIVYQYPEMPKSFYYYNLEFFCVGNEIELIKEYCRETGEELPSLLIDEAYLNENIK